MQDFSLTLGASRQCPANGPTYLRCDSIHGPRDAALTVPQIHTPFPKHWSLVNLGVFSRSHGPPVVGRHTAATRTTADVPPRWNCSTPDSPREKSEPNTHTFPSQSRLSSSENFASSGAHAGKAQPRRRWEKMPPWYCRSRIRCFVIKWPPFRAFLHWPFPVLGSWEKSRSDKICRQYPGRLWPKHRHVSVISI